MIQKLLILGLLVFISFQVKATNTEHNAFQSTAAKIVDNLYQTMGNKRHPQPQVVITTCQNVGQCAGARYKKYSNVIELEDRLYQVCQSFGKDSLNALAFVLGHELGHYYRTYDPEVLGFNDNSNKNTDVEKEHLADIHGILNAYLAGYDMRSIIPKLLNSIYEAYHLKGKPLYRYPSLEERQYTPQQVLEQVNKLIHVFELANYLSAIGAYEAAATSYTYILQYYKGREIYNNLGVCYSLHAMNFTEIDYDLYLFPLELDLDTRLKKQKSGTGVDAISREEVRKRNALLDSAMQQFKIVSKMDKNYLLDDLNRICVHILKQEYQEAQRYFQASALEKKAFHLRKGTLERAKIELVRALILTHQWQGKQQAIQIWSNLANNFNEGIAYQAKYNLSVIQETKPPTSTIEYECYEPVNTNDIIDQFTLLKQPKDGFPLNPFGTTLAIIKKRNSFVYILSFPNGQQIVLQRIVSGSFKNTQRVSYPDLHFNSINTTLANGQYYFTCGKKQTAFLATSGNRLKEWAKYQFF